MFDQSDSYLSKKTQANILIEKHNALRADIGGDKRRSLLRADFFATVAIFGVLNSLNEFADQFAPDSQLSERSLNPVFEDGYISDLSLREIVRLADVYPLLEKAIDTQYGPDTVQTWRSSAITASQTKYSQQLALFA